MPASDGARVFAQLLDLSNLEHDSAVSLQSERQRALMLHPLLSRGADGGPLRVELVVGPISGEAQMSELLVNLDGRRIQLRPRRLVQGLVRELVAPILQPVERRTIAQERLISQKSDAAGER